MEYCREGRLTGRGGVLGSRLFSSISRSELTIPFVGIIHPCKIYNVLRVGAPVLHVGPAQSHVADIFDEYHNVQFCAARHGDVDAVVAQTRAAADQVARPNPVEISFADRFSRQVLVSKMLDIVHTALQSANSGARMTLHA